MQTQSNTGAVVGIFEQPALAVIDPQSYNAVHSTIADVFSTGQVSEFLRSLDRRSLRIRDFEAVLHNGLLGTETKVRYDRLENADQGQIREFYLASLERVSPELRQKFFKLYAYY